MYSDDEQERTLPIVREYISTLKMVVNICDRYPEHTGLELKQIFQECIDLEREYYRIE